METLSRHHAMLVLVADALGPQLLDQVVFLGGCTTGLLISDPFTKEQVRYTDDVDLIVEVAGRADWHRFEAKLRHRGFTNDPEIICRMRLGSLKVDFMPTDSAILGFTNRWYGEALDAAESHRLTEELTIRLVTPPYFLATKLEAFLGRGNDDPLSSHDIEDLLNLIDGRPTIIEELRRVSSELRTYLSTQLFELLNNSDFEYAIQSTCRNQPGREAVLFETLETIIELN